MGLNPNLNPKYIVFKKESESILNLKFERGYLSLCH